jgi:hypothetical protein
MHIQKSWPHYSYKNKKGFVAGWDQIEVFTGCS